MSPSDRLWLQAEVTGVTFTLNHWPELVHGRRPPCTLEYHLLLRRRLQRSTAALLNSLCQLAGVSRITSTVCVFTPDRAHASMTVMCVEGTTQRWNVEAKIRLSFVLLSRRPRPLTNS